MYTVISSGRQNAGVQLNMPSKSTRGRDVYRALLEAVRAGVYPPGAALREEEVARRLKVSRTPVREALARLQEKGLVESGKGRSLTVAALSDKQLADLYATRAELEGLVARFAAKHATAAEIVQLRTLNGLFRSAADPETAYERNRQFHAQMYEATRNTYLRQAVEDLHETIAILQQTTFRVEGRIQMAAREHDQIIDALERRNPELACQLAIAHIAYALEARLNLLKSPEESPSA